MKRHDVVRGTLLGLILFGSAVGWGIIVTMAVLWWI